MAHKNRTAIFSDVRQAKTNFNFGTSLLKALILDQTNSASSIAVSPVYVLCALAQLNLGAKYLTEKEIAKIFGRGKIRICFGQSRRIDSSNPCLAYR